jgi:hypothetical protein
VNVYLDSSVLTKVALVVSMVSSFVQFRQQPNVSTVYLTLQIGLEVVNDAMLTSSYSLLKTPV